MLPSAPHSAPANIVFNTQAIPISPGELDFNELHIPSPFLGPHSNAGSASQVGASSQNNSGARASASMGKRRNASSSGDESSVTSKPARKRQSPAIRAPSIGPSSSRRGSVRGTRSANSTPLFPAPVSSTRPSPAQRSMHGSNDVPGDTPSPVDPPMPPPVHPASYTPPVMTSNPSTTSSSPPLPSTPASPAVAVPPSQITPVTPASMLKLGRLAMSSALTTQEDPSAQKQREGKSGGRSSGSKARATDKVANISLTSPALKPIRPAGNAVMTPMTASPTSPFTQPMHVRKTSHKAAEQKRRDSLKTSFDDLRVLLPPIPLPSDEGFPDEPILPGAMPPRGPPKGNAEGPNRGVSKLQLLRCGNEFIKILKGRVERRDEEIAKLRQEVKRLRDLVGEEAAKPPAGQEMIDLERDLDACEISTGNIFKRTRALSITEGDGEDEGDY
ncbi:hypothetical protein BD414DRAFT_422802 [Trametes punicea]|nr:hypothetical protein BD414DRAFT_422802 [Trametes punicea]